MSNHVVAIYLPLVCLLLDSSSAVATMLSMATNLTAKTHLYLLFLPLAAHSFKNRPRSLYDGTLLIAPEGGNTHRICHPPRCGHWWSGCRPRRNRLATDVYPWLILMYKQKYREWKAIPKVQPSSRGDSGLPQCRGYRSAPEVTRSASIAMIGSVVVDPLLIAIFWGFSVIISHKWVQSLLQITAFLLK